MNVLGQEIEVITYPHHGGFLSVAYLPGGRRVASAPWDTRTGAETDVYKKLKEMFTPKFDPAKTYEAADFDPRDYLLAGDEAAILKAMRFEQAPAGGNVERKWVRREGEIEIIVDDFGDVWFITGNVLTPQGWERKQVESYYPDKRSRDLRDMIEEVDAICRGVYEAAPASSPEAAPPAEFDAREYVLDPEAKPQVAINDVRDELRKWYDLVEVYTAPKDTGGSSAFPQFFHQGNRYRFRCKRTRPIPPPYNMATPYYERVKPQAFRADLEKTIRRVLEDEHGFHVETLEFQGQTFTNLLILLDAWPYDQKTAGM